MRVVIVPEFDHPGMAIERRLDDASLHAAATAVDDANLEEAGGGGRIDVVVDDGSHVAGRERVQIELVLYRDSYGFLSHRPDP
jgi:hypothetical protein